MSEDQLAYHFDEITEPFRKLQLSEVPKEVLMERIDRKFAFHENRIGELLEGLHPYYDLVEAAGSVIAPYHSQYLDTADFGFYSRHHRGFKNREKVRFRSYPKTGTAFLEHKKKNNKGRTSKMRIPVDLNFVLGEKGKSFLNGRLVNFGLDKLSPSAAVDYLRLGFISKKGDERFSIDFNITATLNDDHKDFGNVAILEVKQDHHETSPVITKMRASGMREVSMSKYCLALSMLRPSLKSNFFKPALRRIRKINHEYV